MEGLSGNTATSHSFTPAADGTPPPMENLPWLDDLFKDPSSFLVPEPVIPVGKILGIKHYAQRLDAKYDRLCAEREDYLLQRDQVVYEWASGRYKIDFVRDSRDSLSKSLKAFALGNPSQSDIENFQKYQDQLLDDSRAFDKQIEKLLELGTSIKEKEAQVHRAQKHLMQTADKLLKSIENTALFPLQDLDTLVDSTDSFPSQSSAGEVDAGTHPAVADFYEKMANVRIMEERLGQLIADHNEESTRRVLLEDQDKSPGLSEEEFQASYQQSYRAAEDDIAQASEAAEAALIACDIKGVVSQIDQRLLMDRFRGYLETPKRSADTPSEHPSPLMLDQPERWLSNVLDTHHIVSSTRLNVATNAPDGVPPLSHDQPDLHYPDENILEWRNVVSNAVNEQSNRITKRDKELISPPSSALYPPPSAKIDSEPEEKELPTSTPELDKAVELFLPVSRVLEGPEEDGGWMRVPKNAPAQGSQLRTTSTLVSAMGTRQTRSWSESRASTLIPPESLDLAIAKWHDLVDGSQ